MERVLVVGGIRIPSFSGIQVVRFESPLMELSHLVAQEYSTVVVDLPSNTNPISKFYLDQVLEWIHRFQVLESGTPVIVVARENSIELERRIRKEGVFYYLCGEPEPNNWKEILNLSFAYSTSRRTNETYLSLAS